MKKILSVLMAALLLCTVLVGCGGGNDNAANAATVKVTVEGEDEDVVAPVVEEFFKANF